MIEGITLINKTTNEQLELNMLTSPFYILKSCSWGAISATHNTTQYANQIGVSLDSTVLGTRTVEIIGYIIADSDEEMTIRKRFLNRFINPIKALDLVYDTYRLEVQPTSTIQYTQDEKENNNVISKFQISAVALDPLFHDKDLKLINIFNTNPLFKFPFKIPSGIGIKFGQRTSNSLFVINSDSDFVVGFTLKIRMKAKGTKTLVIENIDTNEKMQITKENDEAFDVGEILVVDTVFGERSIKHIDTDENEKDYYKQMDLNSEWLTLEPGQNRFKLSWITEQDPSTGYPIYVPPNDFCDCVLEFTNSYMEVEECY